MFSRTEVSILRFLSVQGLRKAVRYDRCDCGQAFHLAEQGLGSLGLPSSFLETL